MKTFKITWTKHGSMGAYPKEDTVRAVSAKMALKKFFNKKLDTQGRTRRWWLDYDREANGCWCDGFEASEIPETPTV